jgi:hypothetical protein
MVMGRSSPYFFSSAATKSGRVAAAAWVSALPD